MNRLFLLAVCLYCARAAVIGGENLKSSTQDYQNIKRSEDTVPVPAAQRNDQQGSLLRLKRCYGCGGAGGDGSATAISSASAASHGGGNAHAFSMSTAYGGGGGGGGGEYHLPYRMRRSLGFKRGDGGSKALEGTPTGL